MSGLGKPAEPLGDANGKRPTIWLGDRQVTCVVCGGRTFVHRQVLLNTAGMTSMGLDWLNKAAAGAVCRTCGFVHEFLGDRISWRSDDGDAPTG